MSQHKIITRTGELGWEEVLGWSPELRAETRAELLAEHAVIEEAIERYMAALPKEFQFEAVRFLAGWEVKAGFSPNYIALVFPKGEKRTKSPYHMFFIALEQGLAYLNLQSASIRGDLGMLKAADDEASGFDGD